MEALDQPDEAFLEPLWRLVPGVNRERSQYIYSYDEDDIGKGNDVDVEKCFLAGGRERESQTPCGAVVAHCCVLSSPDL